MCFLASYNDAAEAYLVLNGSSIVGIRATTGGTTPRHGAAGNSAILQFKVIKFGWNTSLETFFGLVLMHLLPPFQDFGKDRIVYAILD